MIFIYTQLQKIYLTSKARLLCRFFNDNLYWYYLVSPTEVDFYIQIFGSHMNALIYFL